MFWSLLNNYIWPAIFVIAVPILAYAAILYVFTRYLCLPLFAWMDGMPLAKMKLRIPVLWKIVGLLIFSSLYYFFGAIQFSITDLCPNQDMYYALRHWPWSYYHHLYQTAGLGYALQVFYFKIPVQNIIMICFVGLLCFICGVVTGFAELATSGRSVSGTPGPFE